MEEDSSPLLAHDDDDVDEVDGEGIKEPKKKLDFQDPVLEAIGEFGPYQVIFIWTLVHPQSIIPNMCLQPPC